MCNTSGVINGTSSLDMPADKEDDIKRAKLCKSKRVSGCARSSANIDDPIWKELCESKGALRAAKSNTARTIPKQVGLFRMRNASMCTKSGAAGDKPR